MGFKMTDEEMLQNDKRMEQYEKEFKEYAVLNYVKYDTQNNPIRTGILKIMELYQMQDVAGLMFSYNRMYQDHKVVFYPSTKKFHPSTVENYNDSLKVQERLERLEK